MEPTTETTEIFSIRKKEVEQHFKNQDYELARRRFLDIAFDLDDADALRQAIEWSKNIIKEENEMSDASVEKAISLLHGFSDNSSKKESQEYLFSSSSISKSYKKGNFSLHNISVNIKPGEILGVVGENGNGKTTLLRCIGGQLDSGLEKEAYTYLPESKQYFYSLKQLTGFIPQRIPRWYGVLSDNLHFTASISGIKGEKNKLIVEFILERFGLTKYANLTWNQISSGYRTRFEIARIVLQRPALLILDEPLANLDINAQQTLLQDLKFIAKSTLHPMGILLSSQQLYEVEKVADRVLFIRNGDGLYNKEESATDLAENEIIAIEYIMEFETQANREQIETALKDNYTELKFNGGVYQITTSLNTGEIMQILLQNNITPGYFRDITNSTKRFFNS